AIAAAINLLVPVSIHILIVPIGLAVFAIQFFGSYRLMARMCKWLTLSLLTYVVSAIMAGPPWLQIVSATVWPTLRFDQQFLVVIVAVLGTTITPYLFFWQAQQEVEEEVSIGRRTVRQRTGA